MDSSTPYDLFVPALDVEKLTSGNVLFRFQGVHGSNALHQFGGVWLAFELRKFLVGRLHIGTERIAA
jgi:hypothetical protein